MNTVKEILTSYYFWLAVEAVIIAVLVVFVSKFARLKSARTADLNSKKESSRYNQLDEQIMNKKGRN